MLNSTKRLLSITVLLILVSTKLNCLTITTDDCGTEKGCFRFPTDCSNNDCNFLVTYNATSSSKVEFELSGKGAWVAVGFSNDQFMPDTDILMCVTNGAPSGHYYASGRSRPVLTDPTPAALTIIEEANENGMMKCRISRDINPSPGIQNFRNLNEEVFLLGAIGSLSGATIQQHSGVARQSSTSKINVTQVVTQVEEPTTTAPAVGSFRIPESCSSSDDCDFLVTYQKIGDTVEFDLSGKAGWAGVGFSDDQNMADTDILMCVSDESASGHYYAKDRSTPTMTTPTPSEVKILDHSNEGGVVKCKIARNINPEITNFRDLNQAWFLLGAIGDFDGGIEQHRIRQSSNSKIIVTNAGSASSDEGINTNIIVHGTLMTLAWILFAFVGLFTARYMREVWEPKQLMGTKAWFAVHRTLMTITVLLTVAGTVVIFVHVEGWSSSAAGVHPYFGIVVLALALAQPIMAAFRPHPGEPRRNIFNWAHRIVGTLALILGVVSIYFGLNTDQVGLGSKGLWAVVTFYIAEFLVFVFEVYLIMSKRKREKRSVPIGTVSGIPMEHPGHQNQASPELEMPVKEAMIRTLMYVFVVLVGVSVSLTIILLMVLK